MKLPLRLPRFPRAVHYNGRVFRASGLALSTGSGLLVLLPRETMNIDKNNANFLCLPGSQ